MARKNCQAGCPRAGKGMGKGKGKGKSGGGKKC